MGVVGHFARVLIEMDVTKDIVYNLIVNKGSSLFEIEFVYENLPYFCGICMKVGHSSDKCRQKIDDSKKDNLIQKNDATLNAELKISIAGGPKLNRSGNFVKPQTIWKKAENLHTKNSFAALAKIPDENASTKPMK
ncbi:uncharacterized protein LOC130990821 [Salvia miltiorrhiza]|uniref:uncharacterized protein LOC130990821 n=1 Tax=Salvia miltiorrhiza TaxID=226208 RepID=UPI0025ACD338|nr:uncharacterized protein LOC130990821 [Salvia miltiorrhiza]